MRARTPGLLRAAWLDGVFAAVIAAALVASVAFKPALSALEGSAARGDDDRLPGRDVLLLALIVGGLAVIGRWPDRALGVLVVALAMETGVDCVYFFQASQGSYVERGLLDAAWMLVAMLFATAAVLRTSTAPSPSSHRRRNPEPLIGAAAVVGVALLTYDAVAEIDRPPSSC